MSENEPLPFETVTADEGPSYSSPTSAIDLGAKVMPLRRTKGCLQQLQWHLVSLVCVCMHACVSQPHVYLPGTTTTSPKVSPLFSLSPPDSDTFPPPVLFLSSVMLRRVHAQHTEQYASFCIYHTCTWLPLGTASDGSERAGLHFSAGEARPALASLSTYEMKSDPGDACL